MYMKNTIQKINDLYFKNDNNDKISTYASFMNGKTFCIYGDETSKKFDELIKELREKNKEIKEKLSEEKLSNLVEYLLASNSFDEETIKREIERIDESIRYLFIIPLCGIKDSKLDSLIIDKISFICGNEIENVIKDKGYCVLENGMLNELKEDRILLGIEIDAFDQEIAKEKYDTLLGKIFNLIRFVICEYDPEIMISYFVNPIKTVKKYFVSDESCGESIENVNDKYCYEIDLKEIFKDGSIGNRLLKIVQKESQNDIEARICSSINMYLYSMDNFNNDGFAKMLLYSAFELLIRSDAMSGGGIVHIEAEELAMLCGDNYDERINIVKKYKTLNDERSAHIHHGKNKEKKNVDIIEMYKLFIKTINVILFNESFNHCQTADSLYEEVKKKLYE